MNFFKRGGRQTVLDEEVTTRQPYDSMAHKQAKHAVPLKNPLPPPAPFKKTISPTKYVPKVPTGYKPDLPPPSNPRVVDEDSYESYDAYETDNSGDEFIQLEENDHGNKEPLDRKNPPLPAKNLKKQYAEAKNVTSNLLGSFNQKEEAALIGLASKRDARGAPESVEIFPQGPPPLAPPKNSGNAKKERIAESVLVFPEGPPPEAPPKKTASTKKERMAESVMVFPEGPPPIAPPKTVSKLVRGQAPPLPIKRIATLTLTEPPPVPEKTPKLKVRENNSPAAFELRSPRKHRRVKGPETPLAGRKTVEKTHGTVPPLVESLSRMTRGPQPSPFPNRVRKRPPASSKARATTNTNPSNQLIPFPETPAEPLKQKAIELSPVVKQKVDNSSTTPMLQDAKVIGVIKKDVKRTSNAPALSRKTSLQSFYKQVSTPRTPLSTEDIRTLGGRKTTPKQPGEIERKRVKKKVKKRKRRKKSSGKGKMISEGSAPATVDIETPSLLQNFGGLPPPSRPPNKTNYQSIVSEDI